MARIKLNLNKFPYSEINADTSESGFRVYHTPMGSAPSVTTILSSQSSPGLDAWRERVGDEEADRVSKEATDIGSYMHNMLEAHLKGEEFSRDGSELEDIATEMFHAQRLLGWRHLSEVWGIEVPLHYEALYAGRTDLVGVFKRKPSIIDYKTSKFRKSPEYLEPYKMQIAAYRLAHEHMYPGYEFDQGVLLFAMRPSKKFRKNAQSQVIIIDKDELDYFSEKWIDVLETYHA